MIIDCIFWLLLLLAFLGYFVPEPYIRYRGYIDLVLIAILGFKVVAFH